MQVAELSRFGQSLDIARTFYRAPMLGAYAYSSILKKELQLWSRMCVHELLKFFSVFKQVRLQVQNYHSHGSLEEPTGSTELQTNKLFIAYLLPCNTEAMKLIAWLLLYLK